MEVYFGHSFERFIEAQARKRISEALLTRAVKAGIIQACGADYLRGLK